MSANITRYFLGANSPEGFYSLYDGFADVSGNDTLYIIKGGPGCGKSSFMRRVADGLSKTGVSVEYIQCSGDPDSLDGVYFPEKRLAYADGTAPHVLEPRFPGAAERYLNLGVYYDAAALSRKRAEIVSVITAYKAMYARAYSLIAASCAAVRDMYRPLLTGDVVNRTLTRAKGVSARELRGSGSGGAVKRRFLDALTCDGYISLYETVDALAERVYTVDNVCGLAPVLLSAVADAAASRSFGAVHCHDPMAPKRLKHLVIPELSLAFVSQTPDRPFPGEPYRHLRLDALPDRETERALRSVHRACARLSAGLENEAVAALTRARALHDELESIYNPHVDFDGVYALADYHVAQYS